MAAAFTPLSLTSPILLLLAISSSLQLQLLLLPSFFHASEAQSSPPIVNGLSWSFYESSCPKLESIVRKQLNAVFKKDIGQAAGLLRLHFHDCFVQVCKSDLINVLCM
ncbi:peroxidase [Sarracenia purpurea var. burkii]